ncbi:tetratricopeptide repeat protein [Streptomyces sp. NPDC001922]|uniref:AfsR/SARP family transcriptional regulator n=1 Tax=Streptomyces sp. NPDC001922 TaxID=3364624 RepID=UPI0036AAF86B
MPSHHPVPPPGSPDLSFQVLGPLHVGVDGRGTEVRPPLCAALLATLLLRHGRRGSTATLVDAVWGARVPARAAGSLRGHVARLRELLEPGRPPRTPARVLVTRPHGYALRLEPDALDLTVFDRRVGSAERALRAGRPQDARRLYDAALELWYGEPLAGVPGPFAAAQRAALRERRLAAVEARWSVELTLGGHARAVEELRAHAEEHPRRERLQELLMTALHETGRQTEALEVYARTRHALNGSGSPAPAAGLEQVHRRILAGERARDGHSPGPGHTALRGRADGGTAPDAAPAAPFRPLAPVSVTLNLPSDITDLVGRDAVVEQLQGALEQGRVVALSAISGMGGVGKTAVAVRVAHAVRGRFPDGVFFVDLSGMDRRPADPNQVLGDVLRALGVAPAHLPVESAERAALYRSLLADRQVLLVLDNARDLDQVRDLLPAGPGCGVLVTSRTRLAGLSGATLVDLEELTESAALALLARLVGDRRVRAEEEAARALVTDCGRLPLAVRIVAARLAARPALPVAELARALADERRRLAELSGDTAAVEPTFRLGIGLLTAEQLRAFRLLALPAVPELSRSAAAALLDRPEHVTEYLCEALVDASLLQSPAPGRYRYHDLLRLFARESAADGLPAAERDAALVRLLRSSLALARDAYRLATPDDAFPTDEEPAGAARRGTGPRPVAAFASQEQAAAWLLDEQAALLALVEQVAGVPRAPASLCAELLLATDPLGRNSTRTRNLERAARAVRDAAERSGDAPAEAAAHYMLGGAFAMRFEMPAAVPHLRTTAGICRREGRRTLLAHALNALGGCALALRDFPAALEHFTEALPLARETGSPGCEALTLGYLGLALLATGRPGEAVRSGRAAVALARSRGDSGGEANALRALGQTLLYAGFPDEALECLHSSLELWRRTGSSFRESLVLGGLAEAYNLTGRPEEAIGHAAEAREIATRHGDAYLLGRALTQLGHAYGAQGRTEQAAFHYRSALGVFRRLGMPDAADVEARLGTG